MGMTQTQPVYLFGSSEVQVTMFGASGGSVNQMTSPLSESWFSRKRRLVQWVNQQQPELYGWGSGYALRNPQCNNGFAV